MSTSDSPRFGLRYEDMSAEELEYYREFWQEPEPKPGQQGYRLPEQQALKARIRMANGLSFTLALLGALLTFSMLLTQHFILGTLGAVILAGGLVLLVAVRRRLFKSLRLAGQAPVEKNKKAKWFWLGHMLLLTGLITALVAIIAVPHLFAAEPPQVIRAHAALWSELTLMVWLLAALAYGLIALAVYTPEDLDESLIRPTDFAEKQLEKDLARRRSSGDDFYDSDWITGLK